MCGSHLASFTMDSKEGVMGIYEFGQSATKTGKRQKLPEDKVASMG